MDQICHWDFDVVTDCLNFVHLHHIEPVAKYNLERMPLLAAVLGDVGVKHGHLYNGLVLLLVEALHHSSV